MGLVKTLARDKLDRVHDEALSHKHRGSPLLRAWSWNGIQELKQVQ